MPSQQQSTRSKIKAGLFTNQLISESDLTTQDYDYDPKIINNIQRITGTDRWFCFNCDREQDKWFMMKHPCNNKKKSRR